MLPPGTGPKISIVIPSYNQGEFIEECVRSIVLQNYPNLELLVYDGGSSDETCEILKRYDPWIDYWISAPDDGQTQAINQGFERATGDLLAWQNSDDFYHPGAFHAVAEAAMNQPDAEIYYGDKDCIDADGTFRETAWSQPPSWENMIPWPCIHSEVTFFKRSLFASGRRLDKSFRHYMDLSLFGDLLFEERKFQHVPAIRASFRRHPLAKSSIQGDVAQLEAFRIYQSNFARLPPNHPARDKLCEAMQHECLNDWGNYRFPLLREHLDALTTTAGARAKTPRLRMYRLLSLMSPQLIRLAKRILRF